MAAARAAAAAAAAAASEPEPALAGAGATMAAAPDRAPPPGAGTSPKIGKIPAPPTPGSSSVTTRIAELEDALRTLREQVDGGGNGGGERPA